jgi:hypothetical protein
MTDPTLKNLIKALGTYWSTYFKEEPWFVGLLSGQLALQKQVEQNLAELELSAYRKYIPVHHTELVWAFTLRLENKNKTPAAIPRYGIDDEYCLSPPIIDSTPRCGLPMITDNWYDIGLSNIVSIEKIVDHVINPTITLLPGEDYEIRNNAVVFSRNLLEDKEYLQLFAINVKQDFNWIYKHFGMLVNLKAEESSASYREIVDNVFNCYIGGCSITDVLSLLAVVTGNAVAKEDETVIDVVQDVVTTTKNTYKLPERQICVVKGDVLYAGDTLTTSFTPIYINTVDHTDELPGIVLGKNQLKHYYRGELCFFNRDEKLFTKHGLKQFALGGWPGDIHEFWKTFHQNCKDNDQNPNTVLCDLAYKGTINPYRFFTDEIGRYHHTFLKIQQENRPTSLDVDDVKIRTLLPPWNTLIIHTEAKLTIDVSLYADEKDEVSSIAVGLFQMTFSLQHILHKVYYHSL